MGTLRLPRVLVYVPMALAYSFFITDGNLRAASTLTELCNCTWASRTKNSLLVWENGKLALQAVLHIHQSSTLLPNGSVTITSRLNTTLDFSSTTNYCCPRTIDVKNGRSWSNDLLHDSVSGVRTYRTTPKLQIIKKAFNKHSQ
jgi:hypothetical protein